MAPVVHPGILRLLVPVEAASPAQAIADYLRGERSRDPHIEVQLLNVQMPADYSGHARMLVNPDELNAYYAEESAKALAPTRAALDAAGVPYALRQEVGHVAQRILACARDYGADRIVMGRRGASELVDRVLGSVASDVSAQAQVPVTLVD
ncbi:MAG: universal stress protein [Gallionella sp.]|nr:universal stress protein [Gallionella sp.]